MNKRRESVGPSGKLSKRQRYSHGDIIVHEVLDAGGESIEKGTVVSVRFSQGSPLWFRGKAWAEIAGEKSPDYSTKDRIVLNVADDRSFLMRPAALKAMLMKGVDVLRLRDGLEGRSVRAALDEALYTQDVVSCHNLLAEWHLTYGDAEDESEIVDLFSRRASARRFASVAAMLESNPYLLAEMGLRRVADVEKAATAAGRELPEEMELYARIGSFVRSYLAAGNSYVPFHHAAYRLLQPYWRAKGEDFSQYGKKVNALLRREGMSELPHVSQSYLSMETVAEAGEYYREKLAAIGEENFAKGAGSGIFFNRVVFAERLAAKLLAERVGCGRLSGPALGAALKRGRENKRSPAQLTAIENAFTHAVSVLAGSAGTGKTAVIQDICKTLAERGENVVILAPSAAAASNARKGLPENVRAMTIHRFASLDVDEDWGEKVDWLGGNREEKEPVALVVVDECSLCNVEVLAALLGHLEALPEAHLLLVGDPAQLPPIGPGGWFEQLAGGLIGEIPYVCLTEVFRSDLPLTNFADGVRGGVFAPAAGAIRVGEFDAGFLLENVSECLRAGEKPMILAPDVQGKGGVRELNALLRPVFNPGGTPVGETDYLVGDIVVCRKNDYAGGKLAGRVARLRHPDRGEDVYNGTRGKILNYDEEQESILIEWQMAAGSLVTPYNIGELVYWVEPAFAVTVHRAQGMQAETVFFVNAGRNISRSMLYTAITRAQKRIFLLGSGWEAAAEKPVKPLFSFFGFRVNRRLRPGKDKE